MTTINLKRYYPYMTENVMLEVSDEIAATLSMGGRLCGQLQATEAQKWRVLAGHRSRL